MLFPFLRRQWSRVLSGPRWAWKQYAHLCQIFCGALLIGATFIVFHGLFLNSFAYRYWASWLWTYVWAIAPTYRPPVAPLSATAFWGTFLLLLSLVAFPWLALYLIRNGVLHLTAWASGSEHRIAYLQQQHRLQLTLLYSLAQFENAQKQYHRRRTSEQQGMAVFNPLSQTAIEKYAGPFSFLYVTLADYLSLTPLPPETQVVEGSLVPAPARLELKPVSAPLNQEVSPSALLPHLADARVLLFLFGQVRVRFSGGADSDTIIANPRQALLLAYLSIQTHQGRTVNPNAILTHVYTKESEDAEKDIHLQRYDRTNDVKALRKFFKERFQNLGWPYEDPFRVEEGGKIVQWSIAPSYVIADISVLEMAVQRLAEAKTGMVFDKQEVRLLYETALQMCKEGLMEQLWQTGYGGAWAKQCRSTYQLLYHQLFLDAAEYEYALTENASEPERQEALSRACRLYRDYAFQTMPGVASERALQHSINIARELREPNIADRNYCEYCEVLQREYPDQEVDASTTKLWRMAVRQQS